MPPASKRTKKPGKKRVPKDIADTPTSAGSPNFPVVGIGASAGGLAAIGAFLSAMPPDPEPGMAFVIVQHLSPDHRSILSELLQRYTNLPVLQAEDGMEVEPNSVYVIPPNKEMGLLAGRLRLFDLNLPRGVSHHIDFFFRSLAADKRAHSIGIVLSGTGSDGTLGIRAIKGEGGMAMAQTPASTEFDGMPKSAIATDLVDYILPPAEMPAQLLAYVKQIAGRTVAPTPSLPRQLKDTLARITLLLRTHTGHDFSQYKETTIIRRVERRMALHQIERVDDYLRYLQQNNTEISALFRDLLIGVTCFFRDQEAFAALENTALPQLLAGIPEGGSLRVWVCACSTGEEAYSIAILIHEQLERMQKTCKVQIFGTDIDRHATDHARAGVFPASIATDMTPERLKRFFREDSTGSFRIEKAIRDQLIFSEQNLLKDPPFSRLNLISCRNLLIYLNAEIQKRVIPLFHYALKPEGILFLGTAETIGDYPLLFGVIDRKAKLYQRQGQAESNIGPPVASAFPFPRVPMNALIPPADPPKARKVNFKELAEKAILNNFTAAAVLVKASGEILYFHGRTGAYLEPAPGEAAYNVVAMAREGLRTDMAAAMSRAVSRREPVYSNGIHVGADGQNLVVDLTILPAGVVAPEMPELFLVILDEKPLPAAQPSPPTEVSSAQGEFRIVSLQQELRKKDNYIQTILEQMETSNEELKSANEEMQSVNEEMQSANEELETSREELQSVNEELATVNAELQQKVSDLSRANNDMNNLLAGTGVGTLFVDHQLRIARFTPSITQIIKFIDTDVGRPLGDIASNIVGYDHLVHDAQMVLDTLVPIEFEVQAKSGTWYILSIRPYRTLENVIEGAVITFVDINKRKLAEQALVSADRFRQAAQIETVGIAFFPLDGPITSANEAFLHMLNYSHEDLEAGAIEWDAITPDHWKPFHRKAMEELRRTGRTVPYEREYIRKDGTLGIALFASWRLTKSEAVVYAIGVAPERFHPPAAFVQGQ